MNVFANFSVFSVAPPTSDFQAGSELKANGMRQPVIESLASLYHEFSREFKKVSDDKNASDKYIEEFRAKTDNLIASMSTKDREIYEKYLKKYDMDQ